MLDRPRLHLQHCLGSQQGVGWEGKHLKVTAFEDTSNKARSRKVTRPVGHAPAGQLQVSEPTVGQIYLEKIHHIQLRAVGSAASRVRDINYPDKVLVRLFEKRFIEPCVAQVGALEHGLLRAAPLHRTRQCFSLRGVLKKQWGFV
jgi:hypothetical protein